MPRAPALRLACHNVNGLAGKLENLLSLWQSLHLDIVVAVDTHVGFAERVGLQHQMYSAGWRSFWCLGYQQSGQCRAGVTALVSRSLLASGRLQIREQDDQVTPAPPAAATQGRLLRVPILWGRQKLDIVGV